MHIKKSLAVIGLVIMTSACSWVKLTPEGERVAVASKEDIASCQKVGKTTVSLKAKIVGINRKSEKVEGELRFLARNSAAQMGGNTVLAASDIENGEKAFEVYQCD